MTFVTFGHGVLYGSPIPWEELFPFPLNVACTRCRAPMGQPCKTLDRNKRWSKKRKYNKWYAFSPGEKLPHKERVTAAKIKQVEDKLDRI